MIHDPHQWVSAAEARGLGLTAGDLTRAVKEGRVRTVQERGNSPRFARRDVLLAAGILAAD